MIQLYITVQMGTDRHTHETDRHTWDREKHMEQSNTYGTDTHGTDTHMGQTHIWDRHTLVNLKIKLC